MIESVMALSRNTLLRICLVMTAGMLILGLWPLNYLPTNQISTPDDGAGVRFLGRGGAISTGGEIGRHPAGHPITLEVYLRPLTTYHRWVPNILSLCDEKGKEILYLGQWKDHIVMRLLEFRGVATRIERETGLPVSLHPNTPIFLTFVFSPDRTDFYSNGSLAGTFHGLDVSGVLNRRPVRALVLGNSSLGDSPWMGDILSFSIFNGALDPTAIRYRFRLLGMGEQPVGGDEIVHYRLGGPLTGTVRNRAGDDWNLIIPETLTPLRREFLTLPQADHLQNRRFLHDDLVNLAGFIPLGVALALFLQVLKPRGWIRVVAISTAFGFFLSFFIESNQVFLITRSSSLTDLVLNTLGTLFGAAAAGFMGKKILT